MHNFFIKLSLIFLFFFCITNLFAPPVGNSSYNLEKLQVEAQEQSLKAAHLLRQANQNFLDKKYNIAAKQYLRVISLISNNLSQNKESEKQITQVRSSLALVYAQWSRDLLTRAEKKSNDGDIKNSLILAKKAKEINPNLTTEADRLIKQQEKLSQKIKFRCSLYRPKK